MPLPKPNLLSPNDCMVKTIPDRLQGSATRERCVCDWQNDSHESEVFAERVYAKRFLCFLALGARRNRGTPKTETTKATKDNIRTIHKIKSSAQKVSSET